MRETRHTFMRKLIAFLLLAILAYVQGLKTFHRHDVSTVKYHVDATALFFKSTHECAICDYQLCKDAVLPGIQAIPQAPILYIITDVHFSAGQVIRLSDALSDRGPPAGIV